MSKIAGAGVKWAMGACSQAERDSAILAAMTELHELAPDEGAALTDVVTQNCSQWIARLVNLPPVLRNAGMAASSEVQSRAKK